MPYRVIILLIVLSNAMISSFAQNQWVQPGAEWHYDYYAFGGPWEPYVHFITYSGDEVIQNKNCQKLKVDQVEITPWGHSRSFLRNEYLYTSGDTVFYFVNGNFEVLFNFSAKVNDTWDLGVDTAGSNCTESIVTVDTIFFISINGQNLKHLNLSHDSLAVAYIVNAVERIGSYSYLFPEYSYCGQAAPELPMYRLHCYHDDNFPIYDRGNLFGVPHNCQYEYLGIENSEEMQITISPNPVLDILQLTGSLKGTYRIYNIDGKEISSGKIESEVNVTQLKRGLYLLNLHLNGGSIINHRFIKN